MHPYSSLPAEKFWEKFVSESPWSEVRLKDTPKFFIHPKDKVASAGSCFAQHISRYLKEVGLSVFNAEPPHPLIEEIGDDASYHQFSARYGNVYTSKQLLELLLQSINEMPIIEDFFEQNGRWFDLIRPNIEPNGFSSRSEALADRRYHLSRVKKMFSEADVFIFTIGLTECWFHAINGHTYPSCPGTAKGKFDPEIHKFRNLRYTDVISDMNIVIRKLQMINPKIKVIITVSPVPLVATNTERNVLVASTYSKSVLRAVAGDLESHFTNVDYFPSFEIINSVSSFGQYLATNLREVSERGVRHVMTKFFESYYVSMDSNRKNDLSRTTKENLKAYRSQLLPLCEEVFNSPAAP
jgi:hypothetical protein